MSSTPTIVVATGGRPPVEHRIAGVDRRTIVPGLIALLIIALWVYILPAINSSLSYTDQTRAGDVMIIGPKSTMGVPAGWGIDAGLRVPDPSRIQSSANARTTLVNGAVAVQTQAGQWTGTPAELVKKTMKDSALLESQARLRLKGTPQTFTTSRGDHGVIQEYQTVNGQGAVAGFAENGVGITFTIAGNENVLTKKADDLGLMLRSINVGGAETTR